MLALVPDHFPWIPHQIGGGRTSRIQAAREDMNLEELADKRIHGYFREPFIHFALASACQGSPRESEAGSLPISPASQRGAQRFARDPANPGSIGSQGLAVSRLFDWHGRDSSPAGAGHPAAGTGRAPPPPRHCGLLRAVGDPETAAFLKEQPVRIEYLEFDWSLNAQAGRLNRRSLFSCVSKSCS